MKQPQELKKAHKKKQHYYGFLCAAFGALFYALTSICIKLAAPTVCMPVLIFSRFFIGLLILLPWIAREKIDFDWKNFPQHLIRDVGGLIGIVCFFYNIGQLPLVDAQTLSNSFALFMPIAIFLFMGRVVVRKKRIFALFVGFFGVLIMLRPTSAGFHQIATLIGCVGAFATAIAQVYIKKLSLIETQRSILFSYFALASILSLPWVFYCWQPIHDWKTWIYIIGMSIFGALFQYLRGISYLFLPISKASVIAYLSVVFGGFFGWLFWNEIPSFWTWIGIIFIIGGCLLVVFEAPRSTP